MGTDHKSPVSVRLPPHGPSVGQARRFLSRTLTEHRLDHLVDDATLAASELVTNALLHAVTPIEIKVRFGPTRVRVDVHDDSPVLPTVRDYDDEATTGRGLTVLTALADEVGVDRSGTGKSVWFTMLTGTAPQPAGTTATVPTAAELALPAPISVDRVAVLRGLPVALWQAARQHEDAALRELALFYGPRLDGSIEAWSWFGDSTSAHAELEEATTRAVLAEESSPDGRTAGAPPGTVDVDVPITDGLPGRLVRLLDALDDAEGRAARDELLIPPALPEVTALRDWRCEQVIAQANGSPPTPWSAARLTELDAEHPPAVPSPAHRPEDVAHITRSHRALVAGDDLNRVVAVSAPAAALLRWDADELVGRRLVTLVPPALREAHIAGFTRHQTTGTSHVLGRRLELPVLLGDGTQRALYLRITREPAGPRLLYVAELVEP